MAEGLPPTGTVSFLLTDIEASTRLWEEFPVQMAVALARHDVIVRSAITERHGYVFGTAGDGFNAAFWTARGALDAATAAQAALAAEAWPEPIGVRVRMGIHTGTADERDGDYFGPTLNRAARLMAAGHGGQILVSAATAQLLDTDELTDLGEQRLKDLAIPGAGVPGRGMVVPGVAGVGIGDGAAAGMGDEFPWTLRGAGPVGRAGPL